VSIELINVWYIVAAALFVLGLKQLGSPATAVRGNLL
jgi:NAD/NADP transhydrogenase beta subunit